MKKVILPVLGMAFALQGFAQTEVNDTVSMGMNYANNKWYSLQNDEQGTQPASNWHIGFASSSMPTSPLVTSIQFNTKLGVLYEVPSSSPADFATIDTAGLSTWAPLYNSDITWAEGAFNNTTFLGGMDYGWGSYNTTTHNVEGNRVFIMKINGTPATYKKLYINLNSVANTYSLVYDNLDNSDPHTESINGTSYTSKNFIYFDIATNAVVDREPVSTAWDLLFTQYYTMYPSPGGGMSMQQVTGVLHNLGVEVAQVNEVNQTTYTNYSAHTFSTDINIIGSDWKELNYMTFTYDVDDSLVYFVKNANADIYKVVFKGLSLGSAGGNFRFSKELLSTTGIEDAAGNASVFSMYPNPSNGQNVTIVYSTETGAATAKLAVIDLTGKMVYSNTVNTYSGLNQFEVPTQTLNAGVYIVAVTVNGQTMQQKLVVR